MSNKFIKLGAALALGVGLSVGVQSMTATNVAEAADYWCYTDRMNNQYFVDSDTIRGDHNNFYVTVKKVGRDEYGKYTAPDHFHFWLDSNGAFRYSEENRWTDYVYKNPLAQPVWDVCQNFL